MPVNPNQVVVALAAAFIMPWDPDSPPVLPDDDAPLGTDWDDPWVHMGGTDQGWKLTVSTKTSEIDIEEQSTPVDLLADGKTVTVGGSLAEDTLQQSLWAYGGGTLTIVAPGVSTVGKTTLTLTDALEKWAMGVETTNMFGMPRRILIPKGVIAEDVETSYRRAADKHMYPLTFNSICPIGDMTFVDITAPATGS